MSDIAKVLTFSAVAYIYLFIIAKVLGKKQIAQLSFLDYVVGITIGSIAAEMATETEQPFYHYLIAMAVFFVLDLIITLLGRKGAVMKKIVTGKPLIIIENGQVDYENLKKSKLTIDERCGLAREKDYFDLDDIAYAILETNGTLSIMPKAEKQPVVAENLDIKLPPPTLTEYVVIDGAVRTEVLKGMNKDEKWLYERLNITEKRQLKKIILAEYDEKNDKIVIQYKK